MPPRKWGLVLFWGHSQDSQNDQNEEKMKVGGYLTSPRNGLILVILAIFWVSPKTIPSPFFGGIDLQKTPFWEDSYERQL